MSMARTRCIGLTLLFIMSSVRAETLEDAWSIALNNNHLLKSAQAVTSASEQQLESAKGQHLPNLNVNSGYTQLSETPAAKTQIAGQTAQFNTTQPGSVNAQAIASLPVFTSGRIGHNINAAEASLQAVQANELTTTLNIKIQVAEAYVEVLRLESALQVAQNHVETLAAHDTDVNNLFDQGMVARNDVLAANVEWVNAKQRAVQTKTQLDIAKAGYNRLLGRRLSDEVELSQHFPDVPKNELNELSAMALKNRPEPVELTQRIEALEQQAQSIKADLLPQVAINGGYQYRENRYQAFEGIWMANVAMDWKLFDGSSGHKSGALIRQALALKEQREDLSTMIDLQVRQAWLSIQESRERIGAARQAIAQADENLKVTIDRYQQGLATNTEVLKAEELRATSHGNLNNATYDNAVATLHLRRALGIL